MSDPSSIRALLERGDTLVTTVGPFARWGDAALDAAIDAGAHYIDSTGEPPFVRKVFEEAGPRAERSGTVAMTAMGYDWVPGNLTGALALAEAENAAGVRIGYFATGGGLGGMSGGTRASLMGVLMEPSFQFRDGSLVTERGAKKVHSFGVGDRQRPGISVGTSEAFSLPRVYPGLKDVEVYLGWFGRQSRAMQGFSLVGSGMAKIPGFSKATGAAVERFVKTSTGGPDEEARKSGGSLFAAEALDESGNVIATVGTEGISGLRVHRPDPRVGGRGDGRRATRLRRARARSGRSRRLGSIASSQGARSAESSVPTGNRRPSCRSWIGSRAL